MRIPAAAIIAFIRDALLKVGLSDQDAAKTAELMVAADLAGADAHGVFRLPHYVRRIKAGGINPRPNIKVEKTASATAMVDGDNGMGHLVMARAAATAIALAKDTGVAWVGARRSNHAGAAGVYAEMKLAHDMIGIYAVVANANHMPMWGGAENLLGTNPIAFAIPAGEEPPVVLDIATTVVSYGTVKSYRLQGKPLPEGWMIDAKTGAPLTDPARSAEGLLLPIGGYKGAGLALVLGLLAGPLNGAAFGRDVIDFNYNDADACDTGHFLIALDVARFRPLAEFKREVDRHLRELRNSPRLPGFDAIRLPGEQRAARQQDRKKNGIPIAGEVMALLDKLADELGMRRLATS
ncbi:MAG TPA: Ldh family oxidoreductase [Xanthobacteraceae bacterium]|nr:Ldh family oxidoreductase [Xanthobacteraceae bacterium]